MYRENESAPFVHERFTFLLSTLFIALRTYQCSCDFTETKYTLVIFSLDYHSLTYSIHDLNRPVL